MKRPRWQMIAGGVLAVVLLAISLRGVDLPRLVQALAEADWWLLLPAFALTLLHFWLRAARWGVLLRSVKSVSQGSLFSATMIGFAANNLLPARIGEFVRAWTIGRRERISRSSAFATVVVERVIDVFALLFFFGLTLLLHPFPEAAQRGGYVALGLNGLLLGFLVVAERNPESARRVALRISGRAPARFQPKVRSLIENFVVGLGVLRQGPAIAEVAVYSLFMYLVTIAGVYVCLEAFDFALPWYASMVLFVAVTLSFVVAPTPGYVGAVQVACVWGLSLFAVDRSAAFSFSLFYHASQYLPITAVGLWFLARQGLTLGQVAGATGKEVNEIA